MKKSIHIAPPPSRCSCRSPPARWPPRNPGPAPQEQMACRSDAGKFCAEHIGKPPQMNACLQGEQGEAVGRLPQGGGIARRVKPPRFVRKDSIQIEQPDPRRFSPHRFDGEGLPRLGHFPDSLLDRLQFLLARLLDTAPLGPALAAFGPPLFSGRPLDVSVACPAKAS